MTHFLGFCYLGFGMLILSVHAASLPLPFCLPPRHLQSFLLSPPQSSNAHGMHGIGEVSESTMPHCASGEVSEESTTTASALQAAISTQPACVLLNTASQSHLSHCVKQSSIHPPDKIHNSSLPLQAPEVLNLFPPTQPPPSPAGAPHITLLKTPKKSIYLFFLWVKGSVEALHLHGHFEQRLLRYDCSHHKQIQ